MKVLGPRIKEAPKSEPKKEPARLDVRGGNRDNVQFAQKPRDVFQRTPSEGGTRAGNLRLGESHADNISKGPRDGAGAPSTVPAGSIHTLLNRLFPKPAKPGVNPEAGRSNIGTHGSRLRPGDGHGSLVTLGVTKPGGDGFGTGTNTGIVPPGTPGSSAPVTGASGGSRPKALLSKQALLDLKSPELTPKLVNKLSKATTLQKVEKLTRFLSTGVQTQVMRMARAAYDGDARFGGSKADNLQN